VTVTVHTSFVHPLSQPGGDVDVLGGKGASLVRLTEAGFNAYVGKPINLNEFLATVRKLLEVPSK